MAHKTNIPEKFTVHYCHNCDGGGQERDTAVYAIQSVFPNIEVETQKSHNFPIRVSIMTSNGDVIFECDQRDLFRKYATNRERTIKTIQETLKKLYL